MSVNFYTGANQVIVKNTLTDELKTSYDDAVELVNKLGGDATVEGSVAQRVAAIVANAPEKYDTLKEIATWIESDTDGAAKMQADISTLEADKLDKTSVSSWAKASTKPDYTASEINLANGTSVESAVSTLNSNSSGIKKQLDSGDSTYIYINDGDWYGGIVLISIWRETSGIRGIYMAQPGNGSNTNVYQQATVTPIKELSSISIEAAIDSKYSSIKITNNYTSHVFVRAVALCGSQPAWLE